MSKLVKIIGASSIALFAQLSMAQSMADPSYSINNYKHPNKAEWAKKSLEAKPIEVYEEVVPEGTSAETNLTSTSNYKTMTPQKSKTRKFRKVDACPTSSTMSMPAMGNYKHQFQERVRKPKTEKKQTDNNGAVANN